MISNVTLSPILVFLFKAIFSIVKSGLTTSTVSFEVVLLVSLELPDTTFTKVPFVVVLNTT